MADEQNKNNKPSGQSGSNQKPYNPYSNKSDDTDSKKPTKQQGDELQKLSEQLRSDKEDKGGNFGGIIKRILIILLVLILLAGIGFAIYFFTKNTGSVTSGGVIKLSISVDEYLDNISPDMPTLSTSKVYPGDKFSVRCLIRNADNISGDNDTTGQSIFIRYKVSLEIDGNSYNNIVLPVISDLAKENWHVYNPDEEVDTYVWDGYYYYYGALISDQSLTLFDEICFDFHNTTNNLGGRDAKIVISVEAVQADVANIGVESSNAWNTAPRRWITNMQKGIDNSGNRVNI